MGEVFAGRYELLDPVATGGMGAIWRVLDRSDGQVKAAKILRQSDAGSLLRFVREQSMRIDHPHVVTPLSWAGVDDRVLFTMPLVRGGSVADLVREKGEVPLRWATLLTDQLLQALEAVHAAGIVHRDVKPGNLLLEPTGTARPHLRLTDFGIAAPLDQPRMTQGTQAIGTPGYMAPEQWRGGDPDPRSDLYAVGRVLLEMILGRMPGETDVASELITGTTPADHLLGIVVALTQADPVARPATAGEVRSLLADLVALADGPIGPGEPVADIADRFVDVTLVDSPSPVPAGPPPAYPPPPPRPSMPSAAPETRAITPTPAPTAGARPSAVPAVLLMLAGVLGLVAAAWLLLA